MQLKPVWFRVNCTIYLLYPQTIKYKLCKGDDLWLLSYLCPASDTGAS